ncbi:MAG TPA: bifunctional oligoribonuclease/PAP phosphatase NrnA [Candidatus Omnitrophota bacterium]|nr:bifunctional oligoribonuclease/PAP phosphatase NrnA [Candidatus Omnitrophota bacterium]
MNLKKTLAVIRKHKTFLISTHVNPDPDALCSELALYFYLKSIGKKAHIVNNEKVPERFLFLPGAKQIKVCSERGQASAQVALIVDCGELDRIGRVRQAVQKSTIIVNIDHHLTNDRFGHVNLVAPKASSTCEILFDLLREAKFTLNATVALHLYSGIMTDTGSFRYDNTSARTHEIASRLRRFKFSAAKLYQRFYEMIPLSDMEHFVEVVNRFDTLLRGKVLCIELHKDILSAFSEGFDLRDTIFKFLRSIKGVEVVVILSQVKQNQTRVNFRSSGKVNVATLAHFFKGGGHHNASGCTIDRNIKTARRLVLGKVKEMI